ncbi:pentapeptide repeat-containing protein, partial [Nostoc piscinale]|uniref:pentapeptide repeat-containing protein n=1 Tax=Nostoc piscinale TaxID=224012 RepID=UPI0039A67098
RVDDSILAKRDILNLLVTLNGRNKPYIGANLKGANLIGADLKEANLKDTDITEATFAGACLEWANLTLAQAVGTDFTRAHMTGTCVEAWNIESTTKLNDVDCRFIYLLENPHSGTDDRERRPSSGDFQAGEFTKLFEEVLNTVDLIFRNGIDWKAFVTSFKKVQAENEDADLSIQSIANKGDGVVVVKVNVPDGTDKEKIHSDFMQNYQLALQAVEEKYKAQLQAKDNEIVIYRQQSADMKEIIGLLATKPINVQVDNKVEAKNMTNSNDYSRKFENSGTLNNSGQINLGEISGTVTNTINELPSASETEQPGIKELLTQLKAAIEAEKDLSEDDKAEALEQVQALAEAGKNPQAEPQQKEAKTAIKILKGTITGLPATATLVEAVSKLLPLISKFLGLG